MTRIVHHPNEIDFKKPGKHHYRLAFPLDSSWGNSLVPITVINGLREAETNHPAPGLAVFGGTHGNEWEGQVAVKKLCQELEPEAMCGTVILIPQLSESACEANERISPLDHVNMNRAFPGSARGTISLRIADFVKRYVFPHVRVVVDMHAGGREGGFALCTSFHPVADAEQFAEIVTVAALFDPPFLLVYSSQMASGLLTDEAEAEGKIAIGGEFGFGEGVNRKGVLHGVEGIRNTLRHYGMLTGEILKIDPARTSVPRLVDARNLEDYVPCPRGGIWEPLVDLGDEVKSGQLVGSLHQFFDLTESSVEMRAHRDGILIMMCTVAKCQQGVTLYVIAADVTETASR